MTFKNLYKEMKEKRYLRGAKKDDIEFVYNLNKQIQELQNECDKKKHEVWEQIKQSDFYIMNSCTYCQYLEMINNEDLK